jgi:hypothetical protein
VAGVAPASAVCSSEEEEEEGAAAGATMEVEGKLYQRAKLVL